MIRSARGIELTAAGRVFLDHARLALAQVDAPGEAPRRAAKPAKLSFALGFLTGHEIDWLPEAIRLLRDELPNVEITISSQYSPDLAGALVRGKLDAAFLRPETQTTNLVFKLVTKEPLVVVLPSDHRLASHEAINPQDIAGEKFISVSNTAPVLRVDRKSTRLNSSHSQISYAVFCLKKKKNKHGERSTQEKSNYKLRACISMM